MLHGATQHMNNPSIREATPADASGIARVWVDTFRSAHTGIVPEQFLEDLSHDRSEKHWLTRLQLQETDRNYFLCVAELAPEGIVGFAEAGPERTGDPTYNAELCAMYVRQSHQRTGIGTALIKAVAAKLVDLGICSILVWCFAESPSRRFYEALGGAKHDVAPIEIGGVQLEEVAYGWRNLSVIVSRPTRPHGNER